MKRNRSAYNKQWYQDNKERHSNNVKANHREIKREVINYYGGKCSCCGESILDFLAIDHIDGGGCQHRREIGIKNGTAFYSWLRRNNYPKEFQVLCHNCNYSKFINKGICIHKLGESDSGDSSGL